ALPLPRFRSGAIEHLQEHAQGAPRMLCRIFDWRRAGGAQLLVDHRLPYNRRRSSAGAAGRGGNAPTVWRGGRLSNGVPCGGGRGGVSLSGGVDSSQGAAVLKREAGENIRTFTVGFDDAKSDESRFAKAVAEHLGADHTELHCSEGDAIEIVPRLCEIYDEP